MAEERPRITLTKMVSGVVEATIPTVQSLEAVRPLLEKLSALHAEYRPWRKFRYVAREMGLNAEEAWNLVKLTQIGLVRPFDKLRQVDGSPFVLVAVPHVQEMLHRIDMAVGGGGPVALRPDHGVLSDADNLSRLRIKTWMDEATESSLIEGASGTRREATEMLRSGRRPRSKGERMIFNNYQAMQRIKEWLGQPLSLEMLLELQHTLTQGTLEDKDEAGRLRTARDNVRVVDERDGTTIYVPPPAEVLASRLRSLCEFANHDHRDAEFLHPILKASILHFMIGYEHPFCDGNGRTARAIFYWYALRHGYTIFEYMPISERIRAGFARYPQAYLDTEQEDGDLTHFVLYKAHIIEQSLDHLVRHLEQEEQRIKRAERMLRASSGFNLRQRLLLDHALRHPGATYTVKSHMNSNNISNVTARRDLSGLADAKYLVGSSRGKEVLYHPAPDMKRRIERAGR